ncbi:MAG: response regulator [Alphaproteobacteria bacterium]|nr:response regulator [Alphaproteobacteria bacterium]
MDTDILPLKDGNGAPHTVLYVEDDAGLARLLQKRMRRYGFTVDTLASAEQALERLKSQHYDLLLLDYHLPGMSGLDLLRHLSDGASVPPAIILTASGDERVALQALEQGAADYAVKDTSQFYLELLPAIMQAAFTKDRLTRENEHQRRELEEAKARAEAASRAKSEFLATMSHEIRTPMNAVVGLSHLIGQSQLTPKQREMVDTLRRSADLLLKLINDLLDISRIESGQGELESLAFSLTAVLKDVYAMFAAEAERRGLLLQVEDHTAGIVLRGDRTRVQQILMNLCGNALKFTQEGGVTVHGWATLAEGGMAQVKITVTDTGIGIPQDKHAAIFEKFMQADQSINRRFGGSGLGLAISQELARMMDGDVAVESTPGKGSVFTVTLRLARSEPAGADAPSPVPLADGDAGEAGGRVLLVEDYPANIMVAGLMLEALGYQYDVAENGETAIDKVLAAPGAYRAVLMDVQMQGVDGYEATRRIRVLERERAMPRHRIIGVTAHALPGDQERCLRVGMDDYMTKPINPDILAQKLAAPKG